MAFWNRRKKQREAMEQARAEEEMRQAQQVLERRREEKDRQLREQESRQEPSNLHDLEQEEPLTLSDQDKKRYVRECCESIGEIDSQIEDAKREYEKVTSRLTDIQRIDRIAGEDREEMMDACKRIMRLTKERNQYKNRSLTITEAQIRRFDPYDEILSDEIKRMYDAEVYQRAVESDMEHLEKEKQRLHKEQREIVEKQKALKGMAKVLIALIISLFVLFSVIYYALEVDMTFPYLGTILLAAISATVIFVESNRNRTGIVVVGRKINKAIGLTNRVKIKYINNRNVLDYNREKYHVKNAADFEKKWLEYRRAKEYEKKFQENTEQLNHYQEVLLALLDTRQVAEPEIWLSQTLAIVDQREMVEIRHGLNVQRGKLRERIQYNEDAKHGMISRIDRVLKENPEKKEEILAVVKEYQFQKSV